MTPDATPFARPQAEANGGASGEPRADAAAATSAVDQATFRSILGRFATGVTVVTTRDARGSYFGITVSSCVSLSLSPPLLLICVDRRAAIHPVLLTAPHFAVNVLGDEQEALSRRFATHLADRFAGVGFTRGVTQVPLLHGALAHIECALTARHPGGDHTIFIGEVIAASANHGRPLLYYRGGYVQLGDQ